MSCEMSFWQRLKVCLYILTRPKSKSMLTLTCGICRSSNIMKITSETADVPHNESVIKSCTETHQCMGCKANGVITEKWSLLKPEVINKIRHQMQPDAPVIQTTINMDSGKFERVEYTPSCVFGYNDCVNDPSYIKATSPKWYAEIDSPTSCEFCMNGSRYDDEDK